MTMHVEQRAISPPFSLYAAILAKFNAWRAQRVERAPIEALEPENVDDIHERIEKGEMPPNFIPVFNPYAIVAAAIFAPRPAERHEL